MFELCHILVAKLSTVAPARKRAQSLNLGTNWVEWHHLQNGLQNLVMPIPGWDLTPPSSPTFILLWQCLSLSLLPDVLQNLCVSCDQGWAESRRLHLFCFCVLSLYLYHNCCTSLLQKDLWHLQFLCAYQDPYFQVVQIIANNKDCMDGRVTLLAWCRRHVLHLYWEYQTVWPPSPNIHLLQDCPMRTSINHSTWSCHREICAPVIS